MVARQSLDSEPKLHHPQHVKILQDDFSQSMPRIPDTIVRGMNEVEFWVRPMLFPSNGTLFCFKLACQQHQVISVPFTLYSMMPTGGNSFTQLNFNIFSEITIAEDGPTYPKSSSCSEALHYGETAIELTVCLFFRCSNPIRFTIPNQTLSIWLGVTSSLLLFRILSMYLITKYWFDQKWNSCLLHTSGFPEFFSSTKWFRFFLIVSGPLFDRGF